ncbi:lipoate--protein ligase family protein [Effusibacillus lacus]|uniref:Octanoyl-[GcvH]:protein N-octanoyltransferase n=1 Tax=Effusibacillus lacus TaxID=1348429 RepID=A0A292YSJ2_9BACL|nr:lipoate--protein ligase family protein [Effusibacillus lacus]TCS68980.1 octanoyl-[GcvH]:protein N-octanoyltransferase [Effusibacillus lacus]GAX91455.1 octanoyltransferase [Effusibacillus lacus]
MSANNAILGQTNWRLIDHTRKDRSFTALHSFAMDDTLCTSVGNGLSPATIRAWVHPDTVVLGNLDYKLSNVREGIRFLSDKGYQTYLRVSGGAAVVLDSGVLNLSLILPTMDHFADLNAGYDAMVDLVRQLLTPYGAQVDTGEIKGSYCPGDYDISIDGRKFGGLAQRRRKGAVAVQAFLLVEGLGSERANLIKNFYQRAVRLPSDKHPVIIPDRVASLSEAIGKHITCDRLQTDLAELFRKNSRKLVETQFFPEEIMEFASNLERIQERNPHLTDPYLSGRHPSTEH